MRLKMEDIYLYCRTCITRLIPQTNLFLILKDSTKSSAEATYSKKLFFFFFTSAQSCSNILNNRSRLRQKTNKYISWLHTARLVYFKSSEGLGCQTDWKRCFLHPFWVEIFTVSAELKVSVHTLSEVVKYGAIFFYSCFFFSFSVVPIYFSCLGEHFPPEMFCELQNFTQLSICVQVTGLCLHFHFGWTYPLSVFLVAEI